MQSLPERLQSVMRASAADRYEAIAVPPFTAFLHRADPLIYFNYAIPDGPLPGDVREPLRRLRTVFEERGRVPRFEYVSALAPSLEEALLAAGFRQEAEARVMVCPRERFNPVPAPGGLTWTVLSPGSPDEALRAYANTVRHGFSPNEPYAATDADVAQVRTDLGAGGAVLGHMEGQPAGVGMYTPPLEGVAELGGVATLERFRKRGLGTALTSRVAQEAFSRGVDLLFLSTITQEAGRIYERVGFQFVTRMLFFVDASHPEGALVPSAREGG